MAITSAVHGPMPGRARSCSRARFQSHPGSRTTSPSASARISADDGALPGLGERQMSRIDLGELLDGGKHMGEPTVGVVDRRSVGLGEASSVRSRGLDRHLLSDHHPQREFGLVDRPRDALSRCLRDQGAQLRDRRSTRRPTASGSASRSSSRRHRAIAVDRSRKSSSTNSQRTWSTCGVRLTTPLPDGSRKRASVRAVADLLDTGHGAGGQMTEQALVGERRAHRQSHRQHARAAGLAAPESGAGALPAARWA